MLSKRSKAKQTKALLDAANSLDETAFSQYLPLERTITSKAGDVSYIWTFHASSNLSSINFDSCFDLIDNTSSGDYKTASQGWHPEHKRAEMREKDMRYLIVRGSEGGDMLAFLSFMLTEEEGAPIVYIYEIHLTDELRGTGVGKALMHIVEEVGRKSGMSMSMLTVFTANRHAEGFYRRLGYTEDLSSPRERKLRGGTIKRPEYLILSKILQEGRQASTKRMRQL